MGYIASQIECSILKLVLTINQTSLSSDNFFLDMYSIIQYRECILIILTDVVFVTFSPSASVRRNHLSNKYLLDFDTPSHMENEDVIKNIDIQIY
jgi:hypothetical protein